MTVGELLDRISSAELAEWGELFRLKEEEAKKQQSRGRK
jgi:hypothetical protein